MHTDSYLWTDKQIKCFTYRTNPSINFSQLKLHFNPLYFINRKKVCFHAKSIHATFITAIILIQNTLQYFKIGLGNALLWKIIFKIPWDSPQFLLEAQSSRRAVLSHSNFKNILLFRLGNYPQVLRSNSSECLNLQQRNRALQTWKEQMSSYKTIRINWIADYGNDRSYTHYRSIKLTLIYFCYYH